MTDVDRIGSRFVKQEISLVAALALIGLLAMNVWYIDGLLAPIVVSAVFALVVGIASGYVWRRVAKRHPESLPTYYTASSGCRMLLALFTLLVYYLVCGRPAMLTFFLVFMAFYVASLIHHSLYFARVSNRS